MLVCARMDGFFRSNDVLTLSLEPTPRWSVVDAVGGPARMYRCSNAVLEEAADRLNVNGGNSLATYRAPNDAVRSWAGMQ